MRRGLLVGIVMCALTLGVGATPALADSTVWTLEQQAQAAQAAGDLATAAADWQQIVQSLAGDTDPGSLTNEAIYWKDLGHYWLGLGEYAQAVHAFDQEAAYWANAGNPSWGDADEDLAARYRVTADVYVQRGTALRPSANSTGAKYEPAYGAYLGFYVEKDPAIGNNVAAIPQVYGRAPAILLYYLNYGEDLPQADVAAAQQTGAALEIALQPENGLGAVLADGTYLPRLAQELSASGVPVFLRFAGEMNGNWLPWGMLPDTSATFAARAGQYIAAFQKVAQTMHAAAPNVAMVWAPNFSPTTGTDAYYPGDAYVDWVGVSAYLDASNPGQPGGNVQGSLLANLQWIYDHYAATKPVMIVEGGIGHQDLIAGTDVTPWAVQQMQAFFAGLPRLYPRVKAVVWWSNAAAGHSDYGLSDDSAAQTAFAQDTADPWYLTRFGTPASQAYVPVEDAGLHGSETLSAYVHFWQSAPGKVAYAIDGQPVGEASTPPYAVPVDFSGVAAGAHTLSLTVYDQSRRVAFSQQIPFQTGGVRVLVDGQVLDAPQPPMIVDGTTLAPLRSVFEALGAVVAWDGSTQTVTATANGTVVRLTIGQATATVNGNTITLLLAPALVNGHTMVPLRFVAEAFGAQVSWDQASQTVTIVQ